VIVATAHLASNVNRSAAPARNVTGSNADQASVTVWNASAARARSATRWNASQAGVRSATRWNASQARATVAIAPAVLAVIDPIGATEEAAPAAGHAIESERPNAKGRRSNSSTRRRAKNLTSKRSPWMTESRRFVSPALDVSRADP
jgi:hypothetical protein